MRATCWLELGATIHLMKVGTNLPLLPIRGQAWVRVDERTLQVSLQIHRRSYLFLYGTRWALHCIAWYKDIRSSILITNLTMLQSTSVACGNKVSTMFQEPKHYYEATQGCCPPLLCIGLLSTLMHQVSGTPLGCLLPYFFSKSRRQMVVVHNIPHHTSYKGYTVKGMSFLDNYANGVKPLKEYWILWRFLSGFHCEMQCKLGISLYHSWDSSRCRTMSKLDYLVGWLVSNIVLLLLSFSFSLFVIVFTCYKCYSSNRAHKVDFALET